LNATNGSHLIKRANSILTYKSFKFSDCFNFYTISLIFSISSSVINRCQKKKKQEDYDRNIFTVKTKIKWSCFHQYKSLFFSNSIIIVLDESKIYRTLMTYDQGECIMHNALIQHTNTSATTSYKLVRLWNLNRKIWSSI